MKQRKKIGEINVTKAYQNEKKAKTLLLYYCC